MNLATTGSHSVFGARSAQLTRACLALLLGVVAWGCTGQAAAEELATSGASRAPASAGDANRAAAALNAFGFDLYGVTAGGTGNLVFSPTSIAVALSMARAGARGETASQMDTVLHTTADAAAGNDINSLDQALARLSGSFPDGQGGNLDVQLQIANAPFAQRGMHLQPAYLDALASQFGAGLRLVDFRTNPAAACQAIDSWVSDQTDKRIPKLLDSVDPQTRLVLVNAIYLKASWQTPFQDAATADATFTTADGSSVSVPTMNQSLDTEYAAGSGWQAVQLPYVGGSLAMTIIVPDDLATFERAINASSFDQITSALAPASVNLSLPRFKTETKTELATVLAGMGMPLAMDPDKADFSGITTDEKLFISNVVHQANIDVDEKGTEATAATAVVIAAAAAPVNSVTLEVNKPFLFVLRDTTTGAILFLGRIVNPSAA